MNREHRRQVFRNRIIHRRLLKDININKKVRHTKSMLNRRNPYNFFSMTWFNYEKKDIQIFHMIRWISLRNIQTINSAAFLAGYCVHKNLKVHASELFQQSEQTLTN